MVEYNNAGEFIRTIWMPEGAEYGYDVRVNATLNRMLTSSFTGRDNYMRKIDDLLADEAAMKRWGNTMVVWDFHARKPLQTLEVDNKAVLEAQLARLARLRAERDPGRMEQALKTLLLSSTAVTSQSLIK